MDDPVQRTVGERGQVTLPKALREKLDIEGGDEVRVGETEGVITIEPPVTRADLAEGYRRYANELEALDSEMAAVSREADASLGDAPEW